MAAAASACSSGASAPTEGDPYQHIVAQMAESLPFQEDAYRRLAPVVEATRVHTPTDRTPIVLSFLGNASTGKTQTAQLVYHLLSSPSGMLPAATLWDPESVRASTMLTINVNKWKNTTVQVPEMIANFFLDDVMADDRVAVILFDEADKGMEKFWTPLSEVFNKGYVEIKDKKSGQSYMTYCKTKLVIICCFNVHKSSILNQAAHVQRPDAREVDKALRKELKHILYGRSDLYTRISDFLCPFWSYSPDQEQFIVRKCLERVVRLHATEITPHRTLVFDPACIPLFVAKMRQHQSVRGMKRQLVTLLDAALSRLPLAEAGAVCSRIEISVGPDSADYLIARQIGSSGPVAAAAASAKQSLSDQDVIMRDAAAPSALASSIPVLAASAPSSVPAEQPRVELSPSVSDEKDSEDTSDSGEDSSASESEDEDEADDDASPQRDSLIEEFMVTWAWISDTLNSPEQYAADVRTPFFCFDPTVVSYIHRYCEGRNYDFMPPEEREDVTSWFQALVKRARQHVRSGVDDTTDPDSVPLHKVYCFFRVCIRRDASTNQVALILTCIDELGGSDELMRLPIASTATVAKTTYTGQARSDLVDLGKQYWLEHARRYAAAHALPVKDLLYRFQSFERPAWPTAAELQEAKLPWANGGPSSYPDGQFFFELNGLTELDPADSVSDIRQEKQRLAIAVGAVSIQSAHPHHSASAQLPPSAAATVPVAVADSSAAVSSVAFPSAAPSLPSLHRIVDHPTADGPMIPLLYLEVLKDGLVTSVPHLPMSVPYLSLYFHWSDPEAEKNIVKIRNKFKTQRYMPFCKRFVEVEGYEQLYQRYPLSTKQHNQPAFVPVFCLEEIMRAQQDR